MVNPGKSHYPPMVYLICSRYKEKEADHRRIIQSEHVSVILFMFSLLSLLLFFFFLHCCSLSFFFSSSLLTFIICLPPPLAHFHCLLLFISLSLSLGNHSIASLGDKHTSNSPPFRNTNKVTGHTSSL